MDIGSLIWAYFAGRVFIISQVCVLVMCLFAALCMVRFHTESLAINRWYLTVERFSLVKLALVLGTGFTTIAYVVSPIRTNFWGSSVVTLIVGILGYTIGRSDFWKKNPSWRGYKEALMFDFLVLSIILVLVGLNVAMFMLARPETAPVDAFTALLF